MTNFDFSELERFEKKLDEAAARMPRVGVQLTRNSAERMASEARRVHPWQNRTGFLEQDTRFLRAGIEDRDEVYAEFGVDSSRRGLIGLLMEKGFIHWRSGRKVGPFPFLVKAAERLRSQWRDRIEKAAGDLIAK